MTLAKYRQKRDFSKTREPQGAVGRSRKRRAFVVQKHDASHLHYDFRLELDGVLKSWAVPKGPHLDPGQKSLAIEVEDHPLDYANFEGTIPAGEYGGGTVMVWDRGTWSSDDDPARALKAGKLNFQLDGEKLKGSWSLVRMGGRQRGDKPQWLLLKRNDEYARAASDEDILIEQPLSVLTGRDLPDIAAGKKGRTRKKRTPARTASKATTRTKRKATSRRKRATKKKPARKGSRGGSSENELAEMLAGIAAARKASRPKTFAPQLATLADRVPVGDEWMHEVKYDGYRILAFIDRGSVRLQTRRGQNWTEKFADLVPALQSLPIDEAILDGEVIALNADGLPSFQHLQNWLKRKSSAQLVYYVFDLPYLNGYDLTAAPLVERKALLARIFAASDPDTLVRFGSHIEGHGDDVIEHACRMNLEGIISKRADSPYRQVRSPDWLKIKCHQRQEFVIGGHSPPSGSRVGFGALLLGYYEGDKLVYCGRVGTGFTDASLKELLAELKRRASDDCPFDVLPRGTNIKGVRWVRPELVCEVEFTEWSEDGILRHPSFQGLREDKPARQVKREKAMALPKSSRKNQRGGEHQQRTAAKALQRPGQSTNGAPSASSARRGRAANDESVAGIRLSNPERLLFPEQGLTKLELAQFYETIADWVLPHVVDRPLTLVRCPSGQGKACFYQKHLTTAMPDAVTSVTIQEEKEKAEYVVIRDLPGLISLVQMGVLEMHPWPARADRVERPDRLIFDLDPGEGAEWSQVLAAARELKERLAALELTSFVRTTGGKGLHVVTPLERRTTWEQLKSFAAAVATSLVEDHPDQYLATMTKAKRRGKVFIDYFRNQRGATAVASYSTRARAGAPVATPIAWEELTGKLKPNQFTVRNLPQRLSNLKADHWADFFDIRQSLTQKMLRAVGAS